MQRLSVVEDIISIASGKLKINLRDKIDNFVKAQTHLYEEVNKLNDLGSSVGGTLEMILPIAVASNKNSSDFNVMFGSNLEENYKKVLKSINAVYMIDTFMIACHLFKNKSSDHTLLATFSDDPLRQGSKILKGLYNVFDSEVMYQKYLETNPNNKLTKEQLLSGWNFKPGVNFIELYRDDLAYTPETNSYLQIDLSNMMNTFIVLTCGQITPYTGLKGNHKYPEDELFVVPSPTNMSPAWLEMFEDYKDLETLTKNFEQATTQLLKQNNLIK